MKRESILEMRVINVLNHFKYPDPVREHRFHPTRKWRFDFAYVEQKIAIECEGGVWIQGRHNRGGGSMADMEKYNAAVLLGWRVLRYSTQTVYNIPDDLKILLGEAQCLQK